MLDLEMSMQKKNNWFQSEKHSLHIENRRLQEEIERVGSPLGNDMYMGLCRCVCGEKALGLPVLLRQCVHLCCMYMCKDTWGHARCSCVHRSVSVVGCVGCFTDTWKHAEVVELQCIASILEWGMSMCTYMVLNASVFDIILLICLYVCTPCSSPPSSCSWVLFLPHSYLLASVWQPAPNWKARLSRRS